LLHGKLDQLPVKERQLIEPVLLKYAHLFHDEQMNYFKGTSVIEHEIPLNDTRPIRKPQHSVHIDRRKATATLPPGALQYFAVVMLYLAAYLYKCAHTFARGLRFPGWSCPKG
jgi:hypothetical protein